MHLWARDLLHVFPPQKSSHPPVDWTTRLKVSLKLGVLSSSVVLAKHVDPALIRSWLDLASNLTDTSHLGQLPLSLSPILHTSGEVRILDTSFYDIFD